MKLDSTIEKELGELVADEGLDLVATEVTGSGPKTVFRLIVDGSDGVTVDQCASISRQASAILDVSGPIQHAYTLEVSSPGLDRKLYGREDYERFVGRRVKIRMEPSCRTHRMVVGELIAVDGDTVRVRNESDEEISLPYGEVFEARLEIDWTDVMKKGKSRP